MKLQYWELYQVIVNLRKNRSSISILNASFTQILSNVCAAKYLLWVSLVQSRHVKFGINLNIYSKKTGALILDDKFSGHPTYFEIFCSRKKLKLGFLVAENLFFETWHFQPENSSLARTHLPGTLGRMTWQNIWQLPWLAHNLKLKPEVDEGTILSF